MIDTEKVRTIVERQMEGTDLFLVEIRRSPAGEIEVVIDSDTSVGIDACVALSRAVNEAFDRDAEDFELVVTSAGIGRPLVLLRQYLKMRGREVDVVLKDGSKLQGVLKAADENGLTLCYSERVAVEGKKRKLTLERERTIPFGEIKSTCERLSFR